MAIQQDDTTQPPSSFIWGANGARMTPEEIVAQRKVADALMAQGSDASPLPTGTRGWGELTQGLARVAKGVSAGMDYREADAASKANADDNRQMIAALLGGGGAQSAPVAAAPTSAPAVASAPVAASTPDRIYNEQDKDNPFEPSAADRDATIRTVYGEAANEPTKGQLAVASVIRNRAFDGGYGGNTASAVVHAPNQFEPWNGGAATARMQALSPNDPKYAAIGKVVDAANGTVTAPDDPTEGKTMFYSPAAQAALGRPAPAWATGEGQAIGGHTFYDDTDGAPAAKPIQVASNGPVAFAAPAAVSPGVAAVTAAAGGTPAPVAAAPSPAVAAPAASASPLGVRPAVMQAMTSPYASEGTQKIAALIAAQQMADAKKERYTPQTDADGNKYDLGSDGKRTMFQAVDKTPAAITEFEYGQKNPAFAEAQLAKTKAGAAQLNNQNNVDMGTAPTYDKVLTEGLAKSHAGLANGVEDAQVRARDIAGMQGAMDAITKNGGTTGGMGQQQILDLKKTINSGLAGLGIDKPFDEADLSDKEIMTKLNRQIAGAQAKNAVGSRVTNFDLQNYLKANAGIEMSPTANQRLLGVQAQVEQRNIDVGNAIRQATAQAITSHKDIDPVTVQKIITDYDEAHHIQDPITGQDLTKSYALPEFNQTGQGGNSNASLAADHAANMGNMQRTNSGVTWSVQ